MNEESIRKAIAQVERDEAELTAELERLATYKRDLRCGVTRVDIHADRIELVSGLETHRFAVCALGLMVFDHRPNVEVNVTSDEPSFVVVPPIKPFSGPNGEERPRKAQERGGALPRWLRKSIVGSETVECCAVCGEVSCTEAQRRLEAEAEAEERQAEARRAYPCPQRCGHIPESHSGRGCAFCPSCPWQFTDGKWKRGVRV